MLGQYNVEERHTELCWGNCLKVHRIVSAENIKEDNVCEINKVRG